MPPRKKVKKVAAKKTVKKTAKPAAKKKTAAKATTKKKAAVKKALPTTAIKALSNLMHRHLKKNAAGEFTLPGLMKCTVKRKPATKARKGVNPFTGEEMIFKAKPARNVVKVRPLKRVKEMAE